MEIFLVGSLPEACRGRVLGAAEILAAQAGVYHRLAVQAKGDYLLFLGSGVRLADSDPGTGNPIPGSGGATGVRAALARCRPQPAPGAVVGRLLGSDGRLLSAGLISGPDGKPVVPYAAGLPAGTPLAMFTREVDGGDADALLVARDTFLALGGFAACDDPTLSGITRGAEWSRRVRENGQIFYDPALLGVRFGPATAVARKYRRQGRWLIGRDRRKTRVRVLLVEDRVPYPWLGAGFPRSAELLAALVKADCAVTLYPTLHGKETWAEVRALVDPGVEVMVDHDWRDFSRFWRERAGFYDLCIVCRPHNMARLRRRLFARVGHPPIVYDAEALYFLRTLAWMRHVGEPVSDEFVRHQVAREVRLARGTAAVLSVSELEVGRFREHLPDKNGSVSRFYVLRHTVSIAPTPASFDQRGGLLFVGTLHGAGSPNSDSLDWFLQEILPRLREKMTRAGQPVPVFRLAGTNPAKLDYSGHEGVEALGRVENLDPVYNQARVFVAPTRYSAGVPLKVYEAAARGVPTVLTPLLVEQLGWQAGEECLVAGDAPAFADACQQLHSNPVLWEKTREQALRRVAAECSASEFDAIVNRVVAENLRPRAHAA